jgi:peptidoglycan/xylan/chitin deacetylase (PgdA/CDA1 family)
MRKSQLLATAFVHSGAVQVFDMAWGKERLTVLAYHRILDPSSPGFDEYEPNVSATPELFAREMEYVAKHFSVIDLAALRAHIEQGTPLPPRPLLITFDDGYLDNYQNAYPILKQRGLPAVIFLITEKMDHPTRPWWDECAYYFHHTPRQQAKLPILGDTDLSAPALRRAARESLMSQMKTLPETDKLAVLHDLSSALDVALPANDARMFITWDEVRELVANGVACQPHTDNHPILTRVSPDEMRHQLIASKTRIEQETQQDVYAFAYPNGTPDDYDRATIDTLRDTGYSLAVTLFPGPMLAKHVRRHPFEIPRVYLSHRDTLDRFIMKVMGVPALLEFPRFVS